MKMNKTMIYGIDFILIVGSAITLLAFFRFQQPLVIAPINGFVSANTSVLFSFEKGDMVLIDDNINFTSPETIYAKNNLTINLKPGKYYWKIIGQTQSEIRELTIQSVVDLRLVESAGNYDVVNSGNTKLRVGIYNSTQLVGNVILDVNNKTAFSGESMIGGLADGK